MNDVEHDLRELFDRKASSVGGVAPRVPEAVRKRSRRRQLGAALVGGVTVFAVVVGSVVALRAVDAGSDRTLTPAEDPWDGYEIFERTATVGNFTVTSPSDWYLVNQWPWARTLSSRLREQQERDVEACADEPTPEARRSCRSALIGVPGDGWVTPLLMLSHTDHGLESSPCFDPSFSVAPDEAVMTIALDRVYLTANFGAGDRARWPVPFDSPPADDRLSCGSGTYVYFGAGDIPYVAHFAFGESVPADERQTLIASFESMQVKGGQEYFIEAPEPDGRAAYVIAGGENAAGPWTLELRPQQEPGYVTNIELELSTPEGSGVHAGGPFTVGRDRPIEQAGGDPTFGAVIKEASGVELQLEEDTPPIPARVVPLPPSMPFDFDLFFASNDSDVPATAVALGVEAASVPPTGASRETVASGKTLEYAWTLQFEDTPTRNRFVLVDAGGSVLAEVGPMGFNELHASGLEYSSYTFSRGDRQVAVVFGATAPAATELAIGLDIGASGTLRDGDARWDPLPVRSSTDEPVLRLWWFETASGHGELATFNEACDRLARTRLDTGTPVRELPSPPPIVELDCGGAPFEGLGP
jgi:hypothetical protein